MQLIKDFKSVSKYSPSNKKNQASHTNFFPIATVTDNPDEFFRKLAPAKLKILNTLLFFAAKYKQVSPSQEKLGALAGVTRVYANMVVKEFEKLGLVEKVYRHRTTCIYKASKFFTTGNTRTRLSHYLPALRYFSLILLSSMTALKNAQIEAQHLQSYSISQQTSLSENLIPLDLGNKEVLLKDHVSEIVHRAKDVSGGINIQKGGRVNESTRQFFGDNPLSPILDDIRGLKLTTWGKIKLSAFPEEAIVHAAKIFEGRRGVKKPFNFFITLCSNFCIAKKITPNWGWVSDLSIAFGMPDHPPLVDTTPEKPRIAPSTRRQSPVESPRISYKQRYQPREYSNTPRGEEVRSSAYVPFEKTVTVKLDEEVIKQEQKKMDEVCESQQHKDFEKFLGFSFKPRIKETKEVPGN